MTEITRYNFDSLPIEECEGDWSPGGEYVRYQDHINALKVEQMYHSLLEARVDKLKQKLESACTLLHYCLEWDNGGERRYEDIVKFLNSNDDPVEVKDSSDSLTDVYLNEGMK